MLRESLGIQMAQLRGTGFLQETFKPQKQPSRKILEKAFWKPLGNSQENIYYKLISWMPLGHAYSPGNIPNGFSTSK